jgi:hypothetical protein
MIQWPSNNGYNQNWVVIPSGAYYQIQNRLSGLCLDETSGEIQDAPVTQSSCAKVVTRQWKLVTQSDGVSIVNASTGGYLAAAGGESNGAPGQGAGLVQDIDHQHRANIAALITLEKTIPWRWAATWGTAGVLIALAITVAAIPNHVPGLAIPSGGHHAMHSMNAMP